jgi:hypothetical protein
MNMFHPHVDYSRELHGTVLEYQKRILEIKNSLVLTPKIGK